MDIMGPASASWARVLTNLRTQPGIHARFTSEMATPLWAEAVRYGVDPVGVLAQAFKETGGGNYAGKVKPEFFNTCGLKNRVLGLFPGVDDGDMPLAHARFANWQTGARAHVQHLRIYAGAPLPMDELIVDPRYVLVSSSNAVTSFEELGGKWAPSRQYGIELVQIAARLRV